MLIKLTELMVDATGVVVTCGVFFGAVTETFPSIGCDCC